MTGRRFNGRERLALFLAADGRCANCGTKLARGWHADHIMPWARGGPTNVINGKALCPRCNLAKGSSMAGYHDTIELRAFQQEVVNQVARRFGSEPLTCIEATPGSGKTLAYQAAAVRLMRDGLIDHVAVFVPRLNLAAQCETDWRATIPGTGEIIGYHRYFDPACRLESIKHSDNRYLPDGRRSGYVTTYQSLTTAPTSHMDWAEKHKGRFLLVADEAQFLGAMKERDGDPESGTISGDCFKTLSLFAGHTLMLTGTPYRSDGHRLVLADYEKDAEGRARLVSQAQATYADGITHGYLRQFEFQLVDAKVTRGSEGTSDTVDYDLKEDGRFLKQILRQDDVWKNLTDRVVRDLADAKHKDPDHRALIACIEQSDARLVVEYLRANHPNLRVMQALSDDGAAAKDALSAFKYNRCDILVTVRMAFIGYDAPQITVIGLLTNYRDPGHLAQLVGRGLRVWKEKDGGPYRGGTPLTQRCMIVAPNDSEMCKFLEVMKGEEQRGIDERPKPSGPPPEASADFIIDAYATGTTTHTSQIDVSAEDTQHIEALKEEFGLFDSVENIARLLARAKDHRPSSPPVTPTPHRTPPSAPKTEKEQIKSLRSQVQTELTGLMAANGMYVGHPDYSTEIKSLQTRLNKTQGIRTVDDIRTVQKAQERLDIVRRWRALP